MDGKVVSATGVAINLEILRSKQNKVNAMKQGKIVVREKYFKLFKN